MGVFFFAAFRPLLQDSVSGNITCRNSDNIRLGNPRYDINTITPFLRTLRKTPENQISSENTF